MKNPSLLVLAAVLLSGPVFAASPGDDIGDALRKAGEAVQKGVDAANAAVAKANPAAQCANRRAFDYTTTPADYQGYHYWTGPRGDSYYCFYGDKYLHAGGYLSGIVDTGEELLVTIVFTQKGATAGITRVDAANVRNGKITARVADRDVELDVGQVSTYHLNKAALEKRAYSDRPAEFNSAAWLAEHKRGFEPSKLDSISVVLDENAKDRVDAVDSMLAK
jgi:hypothetical protein